MALSSPSLLSFFSFLSLLTFSLSSSDSTTTTLKLSLSPISPKPSSHTNNPWQKLNHLTTSSLARAHTLKNPTQNPTKVPLSPQSYGGYSISLSIGSPPQTLSLVMDTGSSLVWVPCTRRYNCSHCNFPNIDPKNIPTFIPNMSSTSMLVGCQDKKCKWVFGPRDLTQCQDNQICPPYDIQYGSGSTTGLLISDTLQFPDRNVTDFLVGCSLFSSSQPSGIAGFGRGPSSLPIQMGVKKFSYCLVSHQSDDAPVSSDLVLVTGSDAGQNASKIGGAISYTRFQKNLLTSNSAFQEYYYVILRKITVGGKPLKIPYNFLVPGSDGNGGTIIDSGTTFTFMDSVAFEFVAREFEKQMSQYSRAVEVEIQSGLRPCFNTSGLETISFPELVFHFNGGAEMALPLADFFSLYDTSVVCMTLVSDNKNASEAKFGPSIIIGNYQQQNFYMEFDLEKGRLGFREQACN